MSRRSQLPPHLATGPFHVRDAADADVARHRLRASDLYQGVHGMRAAVLEATFVQRCALFQGRMPDAAFFSHTTAAMLHGIPIPMHRKTDPRVHIAMPAPARPQHATGVVGHMLQIADHELVILPNGLRVASPLRTWLDLATMLGLYDLVAAGDHLIHWRLPMVDAADINGAVSSRRDRRGRRTLMHAATLLNDRSESAPESILRTIIVLAGLPQPRVNHVVTDKFGEFVARTDLIIDAYRLVIEYQGDYHRTTKGQWRADMTRKSRLEADGWRVLELNADDLRDIPELIARIRAFARLPRLS